MRFWEKCKSQSWFSYSAAICIGILFYVVITHLSVIAGVVSVVWSVCKPLLYALIFAYLVDPVARFFENKPFKKMKNRKFARKTSVILSIITVLAVFALLSVAIFPQLFVSIGNIIDLISKTIEDIKQDKVAFIAQLPMGLGDTIKETLVSKSITKDINDYISFFKNNFSDIKKTSVNLGTGLANVIIAFILGIYYMLDKDRLKVQANRVLYLVLKENRFHAFKEFCHNADKILLRYISCSLLEALIVGTLNGVLMLIFGMPYVLLISVAVGLTNLAPTFGPIVGALIGSVLLVMINPVDALIFLIFTAVIQTVDGYILKPKLFGETLGVSPLLILITIIIGGRLFGVIGILMAIPFAAIAYYTISEAFTKKKNERAKAVDEMNTETPKEQKQ